MPYYEYKCSFCGAVASKLRPFTGDNTTLPCPECGYPMEQRFSPPVIIFKGMGWASNNTAHTSERDRIKPKEVH